jgi:hypothetical protein
MRMLRVSRYEMKRAEKTGSSRSTTIIADFSRRSGRRRAITGSVGVTLSGGLDT